MFCADKACSAWEWDSTRQQYYYHQFLVSQPDLNWRNPSVVSAMHDVMRFWLGLGVSGFRVDAFAYLLEDPELRDEPPDPDWYRPGGGYLHPVAEGYNALIHTRTENQEGLHELLRGLRAVANEFESGTGSAKIDGGKGDDILLIGEVYADKVVTEENVVSFYGQNASSPEFSVPFNMNLIGYFSRSCVPPADCTGGTFGNATSLRLLVDSYEASLPSWTQPNYVLGNHDNHRVRTRLGGSESAARCATALLLTLRGTPTIYNGDEFGQEDGFVPEGMRQDPPCKVDYYGSRCRDPERTPLQWTGDQGDNAGFTEPGVTPWLPVSDKYRSLNVENQQSNSSSMLRMVSELLSLRKAISQLNFGSYTSLDVIAEGGGSSSATLSSSPSPVSDHIFAFARWNSQENDASSSSAQQDSTTTYVVVANLADFEVSGVNCADGLVAAGSSSAASGSGSGTENGDVSGSVPTASGWSPSLSTSPLLIFDSLSSLGFNKKNGTATTGTVFDLRDVTLAAHQVVIVRVEARVATSVIITIVCLVLACCCCTAWALTRYRKKTDGDKEREFNSFSDEP